MLATHLRNAYMIDETPPADVFNWYANLTWCYENYFNNLGDNGASAYLMGSYDGIWNLCLCTLCTYYTVLACSGWFDMLLGWAMSYVL